mmetsp:Transcript_18361/g.29575  ORF Transcript_18361/g.29575 Transcript_18361/m.29575 type:complete len:325 (-) Transcript_18361:105-1079(-)
MARLIANVLDEAAHAATDANQGLLIRVQFVFNGKPLKDRYDFRNRLIKDRGCGFLNAQPQMIGKQRNRFARCHRVGEGMHVGFDHARGICSTGVGDRIAVASGGLDGDEFLAVVPLGFDEHQFRIIKHRLIGKGGIGQAGNMCAARANIHNLGIAHPHHAATPDTQHPNVEGIDIGLVAADARIGDRRPAIANHTNVCGRAAHFEIDAVGHANMHQGTCDTRSGAGEHGQGRPAPHFLDVHDAAIAAHDHQRNIDARVAHAAFGHVRRGDHLGQDGGVHNSGLGAHRQAIELRDVVAAGGDQFELGGRGTNHVFGGCVVHAERG